MSLGGRLHAVKQSEYATCENVKPTDAAAWTLVGAAHGICMQYHSCSRKNCVLGSDWDLPAYTVQAETVQDIKAAIEFAKAHDIPVSVKSTGHSYSGSSTMAGTLMIWMNKFEKHGAIGPHTDTCGTTEPTTLKLGGGQPWFEAYSAVSGKYDLVGGGGKTVGCCGGWLMGGGLSALSRQYGLGIDNVVQFDVVLANGTSDVVDACSHPDLFWALRGGGGGSFAVVTSVSYRLHPVTPVVDLLVTINLQDVFTKAEPAMALKAYLHKWVDLTIRGVDRRWGGYFQITAGLGQLYFLGTEADARATLIDDLEAWKNSLPAGQKKLVSINFERRPMGYAHKLASSRSTDTTS